jgi:predicted cupin superfamily sugar epimerase
MHQEAKDWVDRLELLPHPEGGFFKETYRSSTDVSQNALGDAFKGSRSISTGIYYLLTGTDFSALHRIASDEMWHFYAGSSLRVEGLHPDGSREDWVLSNRIGHGLPQAIVPAGVWFGSRLVDPEGFALVGCTVSPGFDFGDFEMADRAQLQSAFPVHTKWIESLTRSL